MGNLGYGVRTAFLKGLEALGKTASNLSDAAQHKLDKMNLENRRRNVLAEIPKCVMQLWKEGAEMPTPLAELLTELSDLEDKLAAMRPQPEASKPVSEEEFSEEMCEETAEETAEETTEELAEETEVDEEPAEPAEEPAAEAEEEAEANE